MKRIALAQSVIDPLLLRGPFSFNPALTDSTARAMATANEAVFIRVTGAGTFSSLAVRVQGASGNICAGVYTDTIVGGVHQPGTRVATTGSVACPGSGNSTALALDATVTVSHGSHWIAFAADNVTATFVTQPSFPLNDTVICPGVMYAQASAFPLPTTTGTLTATSKRIPLIRGV